MEAALQAWAIRYLIAAGWLVTRCHAGAYRGRKGIVRDGTADLICSAHGRYIEIEVKAPQGQLRPAQLTRMRLVLMRDAEYQVVRSEEDVRQLVERMKPRNLSMSPGRGVGESHGR